MELEYSEKRRARSKAEIITLECFRDLVQICEGDSGDGKLIETALKTSVSLIENNTGIALAPQIVQVTYKNAPCLIPLSKGPAWDQQYLDDFKAFVAGPPADADPSHATFLAALERFNCNPLIVEVDECVIEGCEIDNDCCPPQLDIGRKGCKTKITYIAGFWDSEQLECEYPEAISALAMTASDFFDGCSPEEILKRQMPLWNTMGWGC